MIEIKGIKPFDRLRGNLLLTLALLGEPVAVFDHLGIVISSH